MKSSIVPQKKKSNNSDDVNYKPIKDRSYTAIAIAIICFFLGTGTILGVYSITLIDFYDLTKIIAAAAIVGFLIPLKLYRKWFHFIKYEMIIFNVIGVAPFLSALFLVLNYGFSDTTITKDYRIEKVYIEGDHETAKHGVILEGNAFADERKIVEIDDLDFIGYNENILFRIGTAKGLFGFTVIKERKFIEKD